MKGVTRFGKKGKLRPRYVGHYEILQRVCKVSYKFKLLTELGSVHHLFHVSVFKKCISDPESILHIGGQGVKGTSSNKEVVSVKVLWKNHLVEGATLQE